MAEYEIGQRIYVLNTEMAERYPFRYRVVNSNRKIMVLSAGGHIYFLERSGPYKFFSNENDAIAAFNELNSIKESSDFRVGQEVFYVQKQGLYRDTRRGKFICEDNDTVCIVSEALHKDIKFCNKADDVFFASRREAVDWLWSNGSHDQTTS